MTLGVYCGRKTTIHHHHHPESNFFSLIVNPFRKDCAVQESKEAKSNIFKMAVNMEEYRYKLNLYCGLSKYVKSKRV